MRTIFYASTVIALIAAAACSDNTTTTDAGPGTQLCPTTVVQATDTSGTIEGASAVCHVDNYICVVGYQCGNFTQQATCTCDINTKKFSCVLANGTAVPDNTQTTDLPGLCNKLDGGPKPETCPTDTKTAQGTACTLAGQQCYYATTCSGNPPPTDVCQCQPNANGDAGLSWQCDTHQCP